MTTREEIQQKVSSAILQAERSQAWVARRIGVTNQTFRKKLIGDGDFTFPEIGRIAQALNIKASTLVPAEFVAAPPVALADSEEVSA